MAKTSVTGLAASPEGEVDKLPGTRVSRSTRWEFCRKGYPDAVLYELQALSGVGGPDTAMRQAKECYGIGAASG